MQLNGLANPTSQLFSIPGGAAGTRATLKIMRQVVRRYRKDANVHRFAKSLVQHLPGKAFADEARTLAMWVRNNIRYVRDVNEVETLSTPDQVLATRSGDCDDQATLLATLLESIGHPTRFVAIGMSPNGPFQHVYVETKIGTAWVPLETTENWPLGTHVKAPKRMVFYNSG